MKTTFPEPDRRKFIIIEADDYAQHFARQAEKQTAPAPAAEQPKISLEEKNVEQLGVRIGVAAVEVFMGRRPVHHLASWMTTTCYRTTQDQLARAQKAIQLYHYHYPRVEPYRKPVQVKPKRIIVQKVSAKAYEMSLLVTDSFRTRAVALRAEKKRGQWKITVLSIA